MQCNCSKSHFIYLDNEFNRYCFNCVYSNNWNSIMRDKLVHFREVVEFIMKNLDVILKILKKWAKIHRIVKLVKTNQFLTLSLDLLDRRLEQLSEEDDVILMQNLQSFFVDFKYLFGNVHLQNNTICSDFLSNIQQYICSKIVRYILEDQDLEQYFDDNQILIIDQTNIKKLEVDDKNQSQENYQSYNKIMYYCHKTKRYFRECWSIKGNYYKFAVICCRYLKFCSLINLQIISLENYQRQHAKEYIFIDTQFKQNQDIENQRQANLKPIYKSLIPYGELKDLECYSHNSFIINQVDQVDQLKTGEQKQPIQDQQQLANDIQTIENFLKININLRYRKAMYKFLIHFLPHYKFIQ